MSWGAAAPAIAAISTMSGRAPVATARILSLLPFRSSPLHTGPGAGSGVGAAEPGHAGVLSMARLRHAELAQAPHRDVAPCPHRTRGGTVRAAGQVSADRAR